MQKRTQARRTATSLLLFFAMLIVSVAVFFPTLVSAEYTDHFEDFEDFGFQVRTNATQNSSSTGLRFVYTIGALYYDKVGFVFSTSNQNPTVGGTGCASYRASTVYPSITTDGVAYPARSGRYWVAVELTGIPHAKFDKRIYVRPYLQYEGEYYYGDTKDITVCEALTYDKTVAGEAQIYNSKEHGGPYAEGLYAFVLGLDKTYQAIQGSSHFYPSSYAVGAQGNDLLFEYSFLWNPTLYNSQNPQLKMTTLRISDSKRVNLYCLNAAENETDWCPYLGAFEFFTGYPGSAACVLYGGVGGYSPTPHPSDGYPYIGEFGWHRIGVRLHQEVASVSGSTVTYGGYSELHVDGVLVWRISTNTNTLKNKDLLLFTATASNGQITGYSDNTNGVRVQMRLDSITRSDEAVFAAVADAHWTCGQNFVRRVSPVCNPKERELILGQTRCSGKIWYVFDK